MGKDHNEDIFGITVSPTPSSFNSITLQPTPSAYTLQPTPSAYTPQPTPTHFNPDVVPTSTFAPTVDNSSWSVGDTAIVVSLAVVIAIGIIAYLYFADAQDKPAPAAVPSETSALLAEESGSDQTNSKARGAKSHVTDHDDEPIEP